MAWPVWLLALSLLLKAAVPMLASLAADLQGKTLFEVCTVYGVRTVAVDNGPGDGKGSTPTEGTAAHDGDVCALSGVLGFALPPPVALIAIALAAAMVVLIVAVRFAALPIDAASRWFTRRFHGPPAIR